MKKIFAILMSCLIFFTMPVYAVTTDEDTGEDSNAVSVAALPNGVGISAQSAIVINADNGFVHYAANEKQQRTMASTTKIMTALVIIENADLEEKITATDKMVRIEGTSMGLRAGDVISYRSLVYGMLLESGNDAANAAAVAFSGSVEAFAALMNERAEKIGLKDTHFANPTGLDGEGHYSTAYDMALLGAEAIKNTTFAEICATPWMEVEFGNPPVKHSLRNHNKLIREKKYDGANGIKTGFTKKSGRCLVSSVTKNGTNFVCVTLSAPDDWNDHKKMYDYVLSQYTAFTADASLTDTSLAIAGGYKNSIAVQCKEEDAAIMAPSEWKDLLIRRIRMKKFDYAPIEEGKEVGAIEYLYNDTLVASVPIYAAESVAAKTTGWFSAYISALTS